MYFYGAVPSEPTVGSSISKQLKISVCFFLKLMYYLNKSFGLKFKLSMSVRAVFENELAKHCCFLSIIINHLNLASIPPFIQNNCLHL